MDKYELRVSVEAVDTLIFHHKYREAVKLADTIDWNSVQSIRMLCRVSDLYKMSRRYEDSRDILELAYRRCPRGRKILYSMCELELKLGNYIRALQLYNAYINVAPTDSGRYVLKYKLYREQNVSLPEQIAVLEELARHDFREKWSYELARLYHRAGRDNDCVSMCDEIIAFFGDGRYVQKALELKASLAQLTDTQVKLLARMKEKDNAAAETGRYEPDTEQRENPQISDTVSWPKDSVRAQTKSEAEPEDTTAVWSTDDVRRAQEANRQAYNLPHEESHDYEVKIDDSVLTDEQLTETVAKGMRDLYRRDAQLTAETSEGSDDLPASTDESTDPNRPTTRSWDAREVRREQERQRASESDVEKEDTNGFDAEAAFDGLSDEKLIEYAQEYAGKQGFQIDHSGLEAFRERIDDMHRDGYRVEPDDIREIIGEAIFYSGHTLSGHSADAFSNTKHGNRNTMVLRDIDFIHY